MAQEADPRGTESPRPAARPRTGTEAARSPAGRSSPGGLGRVDDFVFRVARRLLRGLFELYFGLRIQGKVPRHGALILAANHASFLDALLVGVSGRPRVCFLMSDLYAGLPLLSWFFRWNRVIYVREDGGNAAMFKSALRALADGRVLGIFPEGSISDDGRLQEVQTGAVALALRSGVPIVPVGISGAGRALPRHARFPRPHTIRVRYGRPIAPQDLVPAGLSRGEGLRVGAERLRAAIAALLALPG